MPFKKCYRAKIERIQSKTCGVKPHRLDPGLTIVWQEVVLVNETCHSARKNTRPPVCYGGKYYCIMAALWVQRKDKQEGWEPAFLIKGIGLSRKLMTWFDFAFFDLGLKCQNLRLKLKKNNLVLFNSLFSDFGFLKVYLAHILQQNALNVFYTWNIT